MKVVVEMGQAAIFFLGEEVVLVPLDLWNELASGAEKVEGYVATGCFYLETSRVRSRCDLPRARAVMALRGVMVVAMVD